MTSDRIPPPAETGEASALPLAMAKQACELIRTLCIGELHIPEADARLDQIADTADLLRGHLSALSASPSQKELAAVSGYSGEGGHIGWCNACVGRGKVGVSPSEASACLFCNGTGSYRYPPANAAFDGLRKEFGNEFDGMERPADEGKELAAGGDGRLANLLRECQEYLPFQWHHCKDAECHNDLCAIHRGQEYVSKRIDTIADLDGRIDDALAGHVTTDSGFREFGIILAEIEKAYEAMGAPRRDHAHDPDARDPAYIGEAVRRYIADARFRDAETDTLAELQAERQSNASLRARLKAVEGERDEALSSESAMASELAALRKEYVCRQCNGSGVARDREAGDDFCEACAVGREMAANAELKECEHLSDRMSVLLTETAAALKGPPPENGMHDWSMLPAIAVEMKAERDQALAKLHSLEGAGKVEVTDSVVTKAIMDYYAAIAGAYDGQEDDAPPMDSTLKQRIGMRAAITSALGAMGGDGWRCPSVDDMARAFYEAQQETIQYDYRQSWESALEQTRESIRRWCRVAIARANQPKPPVKTYAGDDSQ